MSVVGVDLGALNTVIAVARNRGVDVVCLLFRLLISSISLSAGHVLVISSISPVTITNISIINRSPMKSRTVPHR